MGALFAFSLHRMQTTTARQLAAAGRFRTLFEEAPLGVALIDSQTGRIYEINPRFAEIAGRAREDMVTIDWMSITHPDDIQPDLDNMARLNAGDIPGFQMDKRYLKPDGTVVWISMTIAPVSVVPGESPRHLCMIEDITERRAAEQHQREAHDRLLLANDVADIGIWDWDLENNRLEWDDRMCAWYGLTPEERQAGFQYDRWRSSVHPDDLNAAETSLQQAVASGEPWNATFRICRSNGSFRHIHAAAIVYRDEHHQPVRVLGINQDITLEQVRITALAEARAQLEKAVIENRLIALVEQNLVGFVELDINGRIERVNDRFAALLGYRPDELPGRSVRDITDARDWPESEAHLREIKQSGHGFMQEKRYYRKDGALFWGKVVAMPVIGPDGRVQGTVALLVDIDASKQAEQNLRMALEGSQIGMYDWDLANGKITWTPQHERLWGYRPGEFNGSYEAFVRRVHPDDRDGVSAQIALARNSRQPYRHLLRVVWPDGSVHWINGRGEFEYDAEGQPLHMRGMVIDVTDRMRTEAEFREQTQRLTEAQRIAHIGSWVVDLNGNITWSEETYNLYGVEPGDFIPQEQSLIGLIYPEDQASLRDWLIQCRTNQHPPPLTVRRCLPDGSLRYLRGQGELQHDNQGQPLRLVGTVQDVTEMHEATAALDRLRLLMETGERIAQIGSWEYYPATGKTIWSAEEYRIYGLDPAAPSPDYPTLQQRCIHPEDAERLDQTFHAAQRAGLPFEFEHRIVLPDGGVKMVTNLAYPGFDDAGWLVKYVGVTRDITEARQAEARLRQIEERLRLATEGAQVGIWYWDLIADTMDWTDRCKSLLSLPAGQEPSLDHFYSALHPDDKERVADQVRQSLDSHEDYSTEYRVVGADGNEWWIGAVGRPYYAADGSPIGMSGVVMDITERKIAQLQLEELNRNLEQKVAERTRQLASANAAKSQFLASMSHEIRTPMNAVLGLAQLLEDEALTEDQLQMVHRINTAGRSLLGIINDILDFSKIEAGQLSVERRPFKLADLLSHIDSLMGSVAQGKGLTLRLRDDASLSGRLSGDALRIEQVLINLVGNALKFTEQGGVTLRVAPVSITESAARLRFDIQDTGIGMTPEAVAKLFTAFTQADSGIARRFGGTGLGLSISKRLVELMGGEIGVTSISGAGSTFWFELPFDRLPDEEQPESSAAEVEGPRLQGLRLLVVDDSQINLYLAERVLKREGAEVTLMKDGQQALDVLRANPQGYDLVLMDIQMPVMDGLTATRAIREELGLVTLPVIALTAGVLAEEKQQALDAGVNDFLPKPMDLDLMASMIRSYCPAHSPNPTG